MLDTFTVATFTPHLGETFHIRPDSSDSLAVQLIEATELPGGSAGAARVGPPRTPFSIVFRGPGDVLLPQGIFRIEHDTIGTFELFLVPIGPDEQGLLYQAIFT